MKRIDDSKSRSSRQLANEELHRTYIFELYGVNYSNVIYIYIYGAHPNPVQFLPTSLLANQDRINEISDMPDLADALDEFGNENDGDDDEDDLDADKCLLDPDGDIPLKLYVMDYNEISRLESTEWLPPLYLTREEKKIVRTEGTVLLLGRSGTGKADTIAFSVRNYRIRRHRF